MGKKVLVSRDMIECLQKVADKLLQEQPSLVQGWKEINQTGGPFLVKLETNYDWIPAFFVWYCGEGHTLPKEYA